MYIVYIESKDTIRPYLQLIHSQLCLIERLRAPGVCQGLSEDAEQGTTALGVNVFGLYT